MLAFYLSIFLFQCYRDHRDLHSFPTRRSSDLLPQPHLHDVAGTTDDALHVAQRRVFRVREDDDVAAVRGVEAGQARVGDRKSTRLNSSHTVISYAVFCLKKKKKNIKQGPKETT